MNDMPVFGPDQVSTKTALEDIAIETGTPIEVLFAAGEQAGAQSPDDFLRIARERGQTLGPRFKAGEDPTAIVTELFGPEAQRSFGDYAKQIRYELYPESRPTGEGGRRSKGELLAQGVKDYPRELMRGVGRQMQMAGMDSAGQGLVDFAEQTLGESDESMARDAVNAETSTVWEEIIDSFVRSTPGIGGDIALGVAGGITGAKIGGMVGGLPGAALGAIAGSIAGSVASIYPQELASSWDAAERGGRDVSDPDTQQEVVGSAIAKSIVQTAFPAGVSSVLTRPINLAAEATVKSAIKRGAQGAAIGSITEGSAEALAYLTDQIMFDPEVRAAVDANDLAQIAPLLIERHGREAFVAFGAGVLMGGGIGGPTGATERARANRTIAQDVNSIPEVAKPIWERAQSVPGNIEGVSAKDRDTFLRGVLNELNGTEFALTDRKTGEYNDQGRTAQQQRVYDRGVQWARSEAGPIADAMQAEAQPQPSPNAGSDQGAVPPGAGPASGPVPPVAPPTAPQGGPTPTSDVLRPKPGNASVAGVMRQQGSNGDKTTVTLTDGAKLEMPFNAPQAQVDEAVRQYNEAQRPAAPSPVSDVLAGAPGSVLQGFQPNQPVQLQLVDPETGEISDPVEVTFVGEDAAQGYASFRKPDGSPLEIDTAEIASGNINVAPINMQAAAPADAPVSMQPATQAPAGEAIPPAPPIPAGVDPDAFMERVAIRQADGMSPDEAYQMTLQDALAATREDMGVRQQEVADNEGDANDGLGGAGGIADGGRVDADRGGDGGTPVATGRDGEALGPVEQGAAQGVADATGAADEQPALTDDLVAATAYTLQNGGADGGKKISADDVDFQLEVMQERADRGKFTWASFAQSEIAQQLDTGTLNSLRAPMEADPRGAIQRLRDRIANQNPINSESAQDQAVTPDQPEAAPADQETDPIRAAVRDAIASGPIQHTTAKGKVLEGYILKGMKPAQVKEAFDAGAFFKDGGTFIRKDRAEAFLGAESPSALIAPEAPAGDAGLKPWASIASKTVTPDNKDGDNDFTDSSANVLVLPTGDGGASITVTSYKRLKYKGEWATEEKTKTFNYSEAKEDLSPAARAEIERIIQEDAQADGAASVAPEAPARQRPAIGSPEYTLIDARNDLIDMQTEEAAQGMIGDARLLSRIERQKALIKRMEKEADDLAAKIEAAAAETDPNPTEAQKEAENYKTGKTDWNGLTLSFENRKGTERSKKTPDGKTAWSVTMPAHYGRILRTEGADGDHVDFYMGDAPESEAVWIIDQMDAETGFFDEHKVMLGFTDPMQATDTYKAGFSDGKGDQRLGGIRKMSADEFKAWLASGVLKEPVTPKARRDDSDARAKAAEAEPKPTQGASSLPGGIADGDVQAVDQGAAKMIVRRARVRAAALKDDAEYKKFLLDMRKPISKSLVDDAEAYIAASQDRATAAAAEMGISDDQPLQEAEPNPDALEGNEEAARAQGKADFERGLPRQLPSYIDPTDTVAGTAWYRGYDAANLAAPAPTPQTDPDPVAKPKAEAPKPAKQSLSSLSKADQDRAALLRARIADRLKNQTNMGVDPAILQDAIELTGLYIKDGYRKFRVLLDQVASDMGMTAKEAEPWVRAGYTQARDNLELDGADVSDMDDSAAVIAAVRALRAEQDAPQEQVQAPAEGGNVEADKPESANDAQISQIRSDPAGTPQGVEAQGIRPDGEGGDSEPGRAGEGDADSGGSAGASGPRISGTRGPRNRPRPTVSETGGLNLEIQQSVDQSEAPIANFTITPELRLGQGGQTEKFNDNLAAITTLKQIEAENRRATPAEQAILARYVGWGGLKNAFRAAGSESIAKGWEGKVEQVEELLDPAELRAARASTRAAHYTSQTVVNGVWKLAQRLGFDGGSVLEPSAGTGNFLGLMPEGLRAKSKVLAVEYDSITARIAKQLYPQSTVLHSGFQDVPLPANKFALAIGNPPFGNESLYFQHLPSVNRRTIHNQFFQASLNSVEPDGVMVMVVSRYLMDARGSDNREQLARQGELVAAMRLPSSAFQENARTEVVTDILAFRKHSVDPDIVEHALQVALGNAESSKLSVDRQVAYEADITRLSENFTSWLGVSEFADPAGSTETLAMNDYYQRNPAMVLGDISATGTMRRANELNVTLPASEIEARIDRAISRVPQVQPSQTQAERTRASFDALSEAMSLAVRGAEAGAVRMDEDGRLIVVSEQLDEAGNGTLRELELTADTPFSADYYLGDDGKWRREVDQLDGGGNKVKQRKADGTLSTRNVKITQVIEDPADIPTQSKWGAKRIELMRDMLPIREGFRKQVGLESQFDASEAQVNASRNALKDAYDAFVAKHGFLHEPKTRAVADTMPDGGLILAVEDVTSKRGQKIKAKPADILSKRVLMPPEKVTSADTLADAITISLIETAGIDVERIAELRGQTVEQIEAELSAGENPRGFYDPELSKWVTADEYLSGEVRRKLAAAEAASMDANIAALSKVAPAPWGAGEITPSLGANWIPTKVYGEFLRHLGYSDAGAVYSKLSNTFTLRTEGDPKDQWVAQEDRAWSTAKIVEAVMNSSGIRITYTVTDVDGSERTYVDEDATRESQEKAEELQTEFQDWVFSDDDRTTQLVEIFNNRFNTRVTRQRDGSHLTLPGASPHVQMRRHQNNAIWRGITDNVVLYDHVVGAGKTFVAIARIMERRRLGLTRKPLVVVPNHVTEQWAAEWKELYPGAKLLVAGKDDMAQKNRRRLFARIASGDYDGIIIGHSQITMIPIDRSIEVGYLEQELKAAIEAVAEAEEVAEEEGFTGFRKPPNVAEAERLVTKIEQRLAALRARNQDRLINFQQMGIDDITVDEAHEFKNLNYSSRLTGTAGMGNKTGSGKALDLHLKMRAMHDAGNSIAFLTGTPISNSAAEMYLVLRNLAPKELEAMGLMNFDAWRTMFVTARAEYEPTEAGSIKQVTRLGREWTNMRTLMDLYYSVSDAVTLDDLKEDFRRDNPGKEFPVPKVLNVKEGETRLLKTIKPGPTSTRILNTIVADFEGLPFISDPKERNAERLRLMDRARKIALDPRAVDPKNEADESGGKIKAIVGEVSRIYQKWTDDKGTQIIFLDRSVPKAKGDEKIVAEYDAAVAKYEEAVNEGDQTKIGQAVEALEKYDVQDMEARRVAVEGGWNAYDEIKRQLLAEGIPESEMAFVQDASNDVQKAILFEKVNSGEVRVIIGSTPRMGAGTNIQKRLVALHHADVTWKPSDIEQREGRIIRQKNDLLKKYGQDNFGVEVIAYATERTVDAKMWDLNGQKLKSINGIRKYDGSFFMEFEDADSASMAEMAAIATGNPLMVDRIKLEDQQKKLVGKLRRFNRAKNGHRSNLAKAERIIAQGDNTLSYLSRLRDEVAKQAAAVAKSAASRSVTVAGKSYSDSAEAATALADAIEAEKAAGNKRWRVEVGGVEVTNQEDAQTIIVRNLGTPDFMATVDGREYTYAQAAAAALAEAYNKVRAEQEGLNEQSFNKAKINGFPFEIVVSPDNFTRKFQAEAVLLFDGDAAFTRFASLDNTLVSTAQFRSMLDKLTEQATPQRIDLALNDERGRIEEATRAKPELERLLQQDFPEAQQLSDVESRLDDVIAALEGGAVAPKAKTPDAKDGEEMRLEDDGGPAAMEMRGDMPAADPAFTEDARRAVTKALQAEVAKVLPGKRVSVSLVRELYSLKDGTAIMGRANRDGSVQVSERAARDGAGAVGILNHEIVHVLRDAGLWRSEYGLFERGEWGRLTRAAEADAGIVASVNERYAGKGLTREEMQEEYVAEMYRLWKGAVDGYSGVERILLKIEDFFRALASALRGQGFDSAGRIMQRIADGTVGGRDPSGPGRAARADMSGMVPAEMRPNGADPVVNPSVMASIARLWSSKPATSAAAMDKKESGFVSNLLTNAMASSDQYNTLGLVPGEVLFRDLGKDLPSAGKWVKTTRQMTAERQEMHAEADVLAREWQGLYVKDKANGRKLHDLMHETTIEGIDPSERFRAPRRPQDMTDAQYMNFVEDKRAKHGELRDKFRALPEKMQDIYRRARDAYREFDAKLIDAMVDAVVKAMDLQAERLKARYEAELQQFSDDGLEGDTLKEAKRKARSRFNQDVKMLEFSRNARIRKMRLTYESNRIEGPYFPLMRFGQFFVAARNDKGKLMHFERASTAGAQQRIANEMREQGLVVETGVMKPEDNISRFVDPNFVADIAEAMGEAGADSQILDAIYQRYLETLPSFSIRKANIHRQGVPGFDKDAIRAFGNRMFHGAHQLTRLRHAMDLTKYIESARREAKRQADPVRAGALVNEMQKRHDWSMNPQGAEWSAWATSAAFVWYLGLTPAAAITNISQTTVVGIPILAAGIEGGSAAKAAKALSGALADFTAGLKKGDAEWSRGALTSGRLSEDERKALESAYRSGALDKSQAHDIAAIGESGAEYSPVREKVMRPIAFLFHHAERLNREVTFLAAYRMAKESGMDPDAATVKAGDLTWDTHFNYENWSRPRFMQGDVARVIFTFRQFQVNMLYRLFRDTHQALKGESPEVRKQARAQLIGITASMLAHAGITGTWGYALIMLLAGMFMEGGAEEAEEELKNAIVGTLGPGAGGLLLKGIPGHLTGTDMTSRIGMPELWFRSPDRQLEGKEAYNYLIEQMLGPVFGIGASVFRGASMVGDGEVWKGTELMVPKAIRDQLRFVRYLNEGVTTYKGDPLLDDVSAHDAIVQAIGFSPARVSERYEQNRRLMNENRRIEDEKRSILADVTRYLREGNEISPRALRKVEEFNAKYPTFPITGETIQRSLRARQRMSEQMDGGLRLNPKLDRILREDQAPSIYNN